MLPTQHINSRTEYMMPKDSDYNDFKFVHAIASHNSLSMAAQALGVNPATVYRRLEQLEKKLGVRLFERQSGVYIPTLAGEELTRSGELINQTINEALRKISGKDLRPSGLVRITLTDSLAHHLIGPALVLCRETYPDIELELMITEAPLNLSKRDADIAIRATLTPPDHLLGYCIGDINFAVYAQEPLATRYQLIFNQYHQTEVPWLSLDDHFSGHATLKWLHQQQLEYAVKLRCNTMSGLAFSCQQGLGFAILPNFIAQQLPDLVCLSEAITSCQSQLWLLMHPDLKNTTRVKAVFDILKTQLKQAWRTPQSLHSMAR